LSAFNEVQVLGEFSTPKEEVRAGEERVVVLHRKRRYVLARREW
jgi:hypothetical protein